MSSDVTPDQVVWGQKNGQQNPPPTIGVPITPASWEGHQLMYNSGAYSFAVATTSNLPLSSDGFTPTSSGVYAENASLIALTPAQVQALQPTYYKCASVTSGSPAVPGVVDSTVLIVSGLDAFYDGRYTITNSSASGTARYW